MRPGGGGLLFGVSLHLPWGLRLTWDPFSLQLVELKNGETYNGHLVSCDNWMNINLREVICTSRVSALRPESAPAAWGPWGSAGLVGTANGGRVARNAHWDLGLYRASASLLPSGVEALPWTCGRSGRVPTSAYTTGHPARGGASCRGGARGTGQDVGGAQPDKAPSLSSALDFAPAGMLPGRY